MTATLFQLSSSAISRFLERLVSGTLRPPPIGVLQFARDVLDALEGDGEFLKIGRPVNSGSTRGA
jgi:hypothetical protein